MQEEKNKNFNYDEWVQKFEAKKTTDDCFTPPKIYDAVAQYVENRYNVPRDKFLRPFYPGGDYQSVEYPPDSIVVDNPPFSIISQICKWYQERGIKYFLFAPTLTICSCRVARKVVVGVAVTYENGANVNTSFVTNMDEYEIRSAPELYKAVEQANGETQAEKKKSLPKYDYPDEVLTSTMVARYSKYGVEFAVRPESCQRISELDDQKAQKKAIFGSGYLLSERAAAERAAAERAAAERAAAVKWKVSDREKAIIKGLK